MYMGEKSLPKSKQNNHPYRGNSQRTRPIFDITFAKTPSHFTRTCPRASVIWLPNTPSQLFYLILLTFRNNMGERLLSFLHRGPILFNYLKLCSDHLIKLIISRQDHNHFRCIWYNKSEDIKVSH
ncbi:hypothetical protein TSUD_380440 [Trifolium subterraneum]|uniref:Uncharacterized protein n=1 Tax=Trifolium subterraneum TaxID=3900 RepID=A0A2Z6PBS6_TRISU|nr:hypothetical protein TSUD_380440 [Trifolium subterraneum]